MTYPTPSISDLTTPDRNRHMVRDVHRNLLTCSPAGNEDASSAQYPMPLLSTLLYRVAEDMNCEMSPHFYLLTPPASYDSADVQVRFGSLSAPGPDTVEDAVREVTERLRRYLVDARTSNGNGNGGDSSIGNYAADSRDISAPSGPPSSTSSHTVKTSQTPGKHAAPMASGTPTRVAIQQPTYSDRPGHSGSSTQPTALAQSSQPARHSVKLYLLGQPQIYIDDMRLAELEKSDRRSQVIQLLGLHRGSLSCDKLAQAISMTNQQYEDEPIKRHYVRNLVWRVRARIKQKTGWDGLIQSPTRGGVGAHYYQLADCTVCDLWEFQDKLDQADRLLVRQALRSWSTITRGVDVAISDEDRAAALREEALQLYRGEFCEGSNVGPIVHAARMLEERYIRSALQQADYWRARVLRAEIARDREAIGPQEAIDKQVIPLDTGSDTMRPEQDTAWREALRNYERVLRIDNYHEEAYKHAMECYAHLGNASGVGQVFARCQDILHADLKQPPGESVIRAYEECKTLLGV